MTHGATRAEVDAVVDRVHEIGLKTELSRGEERTLIGVIGGNAHAAKEAFSPLGGVPEINPTHKPFKLPSPEFRQANTVGDRGGGEVGGGEDSMMAPPRSGGG